MYVADWKNDRVQKFSGNGRFLGEFNETADGVGGLSRPTDVAVDSDGDVYVADWGNHQVQVYEPDGKFIATLVGDAQTPSPWVQDYIDANPDVAKARRRTNMEVEWRFNRPIAVNLDADDRLYVAEAVRHRIQVLQQGTGLRRGCHQSLDLWPLGFGLRAMEAVDGLIAKQKGRV